MARRVQNASSLVNIYTHGTGVVALADLASGAGKTLLASGTGFRARVTVWKPWQQTQVRNLSVCHKETDKKILPTILMRSVAVWKPFKQTQVRN